MLRGHTRTMVAYLNDSPRVLGEELSVYPVYCDLNPAVRLRVANRIADHIFNGPAQLLLGSSGCARVGRIDDDSTLFGLCLKVSIDSNLLNQASQIYRLLRTRICSAVDTGKSQKLSNQLIEMFHLRLDPVQILCPFLWRALPQQALCNAEAGQWGTQF